MESWIPFIWTGVYLLLVLVQFIFSFKKSKKETTEVEIPTSTPPQEEETEGTPQETKPKGETSIMRRYFLVYLGIVLAFAGIIYQISHIQIIEGDALRAIAESRDSGIDTIKAIRGNILSDDGRLLSSSLPYYYLYLDTRVEALHIKNRKTGKTYFDEHVGELADSLSHKFGKSKAQFEKDLRKAYRQRRSSYRIWPQAVSHLDYLEIKNYPILKRGAIQGGFSSKMRIKRHRPFGSLASRTIGGIYGEGGKGKNGLEMAYDSLLQGKPGLKVIQKKAGARVNVVLKEPINGMDIVSSINIDIQEVAERALRERLTWSRSERGTVVLMETATGRIKAISNLQWSPIFNEYIEAQNIAVASQIEPGSTFKTVSMLVAMEDGYIDTSTVVDTHDGSIIFADRKMRDWNYKGPGKDGGFGKASVAKVMQQSSNVGVSSLIQEYYEDQPKKFIAGVKRTGFANPVQLEIPGYGEVKLKDPDNTDWYGTTLPWMSIGYELQVPPIYTLMFYNAIANNGKMMKPIFTQEIRSEGKVYKITPSEVVKESVASTENLKKMQGVLESVVEKGTAKSVKSPLFSIAGKTGTSQIFEGGTKYNKEGRVRHQVTFCGYFPADKPLYSCIVYARDPEIGGASSICGNVFKQVAEKAFILNTERQDTATIVAEEPLLKKKEITLSLDTLGLDVLPSMRGWTLDDALYVLENKGITVQTEGFGLIKKQSVPAGTSIDKVKTIQLTLAMP